MPAGMPMRDKEIMEKLFDLSKLNSSEIASVLGCSVQVVQKRKREYEAKGTITAVREMSWQKIKPEHRETLLKYVEEHGEKKSLREMSDYLAEATGVRVTTVTISRMLKAAAEAAEGQGRRKIRAPRKDDPASRVAWVAPEAQRATPVMRDNRVAWMLPEQSASTPVRPQSLPKQSATPPVQQQLGRQQRTESPGTQPRPRASPGVSPAIQPQVMAEQAGSDVGRPGSNAESAIGGEAASEPMEGVKEEETPSAPAEEIGEV